MTLSTHQAQSAESLQSDKRLQLPSLPEQDSKFVTALGRGLVILSCFNQDTPTLSHQEIYQLTGLPKPTITRLLYTLVHVGYLTHDTDTAHYRLGNRFQQHLTPPAIRNPFQSNQINLRLIQSWLQDFAETYQVSVNIATHHSGMMQYLACYRSPARISVNLAMGSSVPLETTAIGRAYFASCHPEYQHTILQMIKQRLTEAEFQQAVASLRQHQRKYQQLGYCLSNGDYSQEILAVAMATHISSASAHGSSYQQLETTHTDNPINHEVTNHKTANKATDGLFAINASVPSSQWDEQQFCHQIVPPLTKLATDIAEIL